MNIHEYFSTDKTAEEDGRWFDLGPKARIKCRSFSSQKSRDVRRVLERPYSAILRTNGTLPDATNEEIAIKQIAQSIIVGWEGLTDADGKEIPYSPKKAYELLNDIPKFRDFIAQLVINDDSFKSESREEAIKN